jgi:hypothetical protein
MIAMALLQTFAHKAFGNWKTTSAGFALGLTQVAGDLHVQPWSVIIARMVCCTILGILACDCKGAERKGEL